MFEERIGELEDKLGKYLDYNRGRGGKQERVKRYGKQNRKI